MAFGDDRQMFNVDVDCAKCGAHIDKLPFEPSGDRPVYCGDCNRAFRESKRDTERKMFQVDLKCADCSTPITQLPFQPSGDTPVRCLDCFRKQRDN